LGMTSTLGGIFTLSFSTDSLPSNLSVFLIDSYRNRTIDIRKEKTWKVLINVEPASYAKGRLKLVLINQNAAVITAGANANQTNKSVDVSWSSTNEINTIRYEVEHSVNKADFTAIATVDLNDTLILSSSNYLITDAQAQTGVNYYRIKRISTTGNVVYSDTVSGELIETNNTGINQISNKSVQVYPMPVLTDATITIPEQISGDIKLELISVAGSVVLANNYTQVKAGTAIAFNMSNLAAGYYMVRISSDKMVVAGKLIKQ
ncbi:MAG: T9SS type A sorting domain-containing protein, partial [Bacteroidia bacterium]|nr:T9SS type A sorting domain-containing protein [Bacteroidia bacterium]